MNTIAFKIIREDLSEFGHVPEIDTHLWSSRCWSAGLPGR